ncbi:YfjI family protein [Sphingomonas adhaesiva]|uniref:YfjI family protein n=1 Tax=Sphingomonas adhaesiva TaxID=28212 RepID=UPI002FFA5199
MTAAFSRQYQEADRIPGQPIPIKPPVAAPGAFPIDALTPRLLAAARAIASRVQTPEATAANSVLAAAALAVQPYVDVELPTGEVVPTSIFMVTVMGSGDRKSSSDKLALRAIREREKELRDAYAVQQSSFLADQSAYAAAKKKAMSGSKDREQIRQAIEACGREPFAPAQPLLTTDDPTVQGLQKLFGEAMPSLGLFSDEGGMVLGGHSMTEENRSATGGALSKLWDGAPIKRVRASEVVTFLAGRRLSLHLMLQPRIARKLFGDADLKDQGLLSRILICQPSSLKGSRTWRDPDPNDGELIDQFSQRIYRLLSSPWPMDPDSRELSPRLVPFSAAAKDMYVHWYNAIEAEQRPGGMFEEISGFASKLPEHSARLAGVMAYFEDRNVQEISAQALAAAIKLSKFYVEEFLRLIGLGTSDQDSENADAIITWIRKTEHRIVGKRWLSRNVFPRELRPAPVLTRAIDLLIEHGHLVPIKGGAEMVIDGTPNFYRDAYTVVPDDDA